MATDAIGTSAKKVILFIDEATNLTEKDFGWISGLYNDLESIDSHGVRLITMLFGMPGLKGMKSNFIRSGRTDIVARFMIKEFPFTGITSEMDVLFLLGAIDKSTKYKINDKPINIMETLFPKKFKEMKGKLCLVDLTHTLWHAFLACESDSKSAKKEMSIGMQIFMDTLTEIFQSYSCYSSLGENYPGVTDLIKCVQKVDYKEFESITE